MGSREGRSHPQQMPRGAAAPPSPPAASSGGAAGGALSPPDPLRVGDPSLVFDARAGRLRALAARHPARDWLLLLARIAEGQRAAVGDIRVQPVCPLGGGPPIAWEHIERAGAWRRMLAIVISGARAPGLPVETLDAMRRLSDSGVTHLEQIAEGVLAGEVSPDRTECAPFVGAALQAWFAALAATVDPARAAPAGDRCPLCGSRPVAVTVRYGARWLTCSLCATEWRAERGGCARCPGGDVGRFQAEDDPGAHAEACGGCRGYLKVFDEEARPGAIAAADDAATLALDARMAEQGYRRAGANLYLVPGADAVVRG